MQIIPLQAVPSQISTVALGTQICKIKVYQKATGVFLDLYLADVLIAGGAICQDKNPIIRAKYSAFVGELVFLDTQGSSDPDYTGFGDGGRYSLAWLDAPEIAELEAEAEASLAE